MTDPATASTDSSLPGGTREKVVVALSGGVDSSVAALLLNVLSMTLGFFVAKLARLNRKQQITVGIEVGIQNGTTALLVTGTLLANKTMTIGPAIYSLIMFGTGALFAVIVNMGRAPEAEAAAEAKPS